jgi:hypothetical protein
VYDYIKKKNTLAGAEDDPRFLELRKKVDAHFQAMADLHPTLDQFNKCNAALKQMLKTDSQKKSGAKPPPPKS